MAKFSNVTISIIGFGLLSDSKGLYLKRSEGKSDV